MKHAHTQYQNTGGKPIGFFGEYFRAVLLEIVPLGSNQAGQGADLRQQGFAQHEILLLRRIGLQIGTVLVAVHGQRPALQLGAGLCGGKLAELAG